MDHTPFRVCYGVYELLKVAVKMIYIIIFYSIENECYS